MKKIKNIIKSDYIKYFIFLISLFITYFSIDFLTRLAATQIENYFSPVDIIPTKFLLSWLLIFLSFYILFNSKITKKIFIISLIILNIYSIAQLTHLNLLGRMFSFYDIFSVKEGFTYFTAIIQYINYFSFGIILITIILGLLTYYLWPKKDIPTRYKFVLIFSFLSLAMYFKTDTLNYLKNDNRDYSFDSNKDASKVYENYNNPTSALELSSIYEYIFRDVYLALKTNDELSKEEIDEITSYLNSRNLEKDNTYTGLLKDKNVIMIMLESIDTLFLNKEVMPNLYNLYNNGIAFTNRYTPIYGIGATFNTEFTSLTGTYSSTIGKSAYFYNQNNFKYSIPNIFKNNGYTVNSFHMNEGSFYERTLMHQAFGFTKYNSFIDYTGKKIYSDSEILDYDSIYNAIAPKDKKFFSFIVTYSAHLPYSEDNIACQNHMQDKFYNEDDYETSCYKSTLYDTDLFIGKLINKLKEDNILDDTVLILYGDHLPYSYTKRVEMGEEEEYNLNKGLYLIYNPNLKSKKIDTINTTIDMAPTILNLFALDGYDPNNYLGVDVFNKDALHVAYFSDYNWLDNKFYSANITSKDYLNNKEYIDKIEDYVDKQITYNNKIVMGNYYKYR